METKKTTIELNPFKMSKEELAVWLAMRSKGHAINSKKDYTRKQKHKKDLRFSEQKPLGPMV